jgi:hypothetical protein
MNTKRISFLQKFLLVILYQCFFVGIAIALLKRVGAFGCFDDCFNFGAGYFLLQGKQLYSQIFFNHQPIMAYISAAVQYISQPQTLFELVKYHRIVVLLLADIFGTFLILRFGLPLFLSLVVFESMKFYIFGDRFLAEGIIVYPMMYLTILILYKFLGKIVYRWEYILAALCSWFIFWMREPFMPWSGVSFLILLLLAYKEKTQKKHIAIAFIVFCLLHLITFTVLPVREYIFNVFTINMQYEVSVHPWNVMTIAQILFYPAFVMIHGVGNIFQNTLFVLSVIFFVVIGYEVFRKRRYVAIGVSLFLLGLANLRVVPVGTLYYDAFHMVPWYGMVIGITCMFMNDMWEDVKAKKIAAILSVCLIAIILYGIFLPKSFVREHIDTQLEFTNNYATYFSKGQVIKLLAGPGDTMFVEMWEDPIYFVAGVPTAYSYSWYTSVMPFFPKYQIAREEMFALHPPTFYVGACRDGDVDSFALSGEDKKKYTQLLNSGRPSCVYVRNEVVPTISKNVADRISAYGYSLP